MTQVPGLVDHLFRRESARLVAALARALGRIEPAEEAVQEALLAALRTWPVRGVPDDPVAWLSRVARNRAIDQLRRRAALLEGGAELELTRVDEALVAAAPDERRELDDALAMTFMCCHPALPRDARVVLTLRLACGLGPREIARGLLTSEEAVQQRLVRGKKAARELALALELPPASELAARLEPVLEALYAVFSEGHLAHAGARLTRPELQDEAIRLAELLARREETARPEVHALLALMHLVRAREPARAGPDDRLVPLAAQDRSRWDRAAIAQGLAHLERSAAGPGLTRWHLEAEIAAVHTTAPSFAHTDWQRILCAYDALLGLAPTPVVRLNRAVALAHVEGPAAAIRELELLHAGGALADLHLLPATLAELELERGRTARAAKLFREALALPCSEPERRWLEGRLAEVAG